MFSHEEKEFLKSVLVQLTGNLTSPDTVKASTLVQAILSKLNTLEDK